MLGAKLDKNPVHEKPKSRRIHKNSVDLQQGNVKLWSSISCRRGVKNFLIIITYLVQFQSFGSFDK